MAEEPTTIAAFVYAIIETLDEFGLDGTSIVKGVLNGDLPRYDPTVRISAQTLSDLFVAAVEASDDPCIGLKVGQHIRQKGMHSLGFALMASSSLRDFSLRLARHFRLISHAATVTVEESDDVARIIIDPVSEAICDEAADACVSGQIIIIREIYSSMFNPTRMEFRRPEPAGGPEPFLELFRCPVIFDQPNIAIHIERKLFDVPFPAASKEIAFQNDQIVLSYLARMDRGDIVARARVAMIEQLAAGSVSKDTVAKQLNISPRTLQYKLAQSDTSFKELIDDTRKVLALKYLDARDTSVTQITYLLGFSDTSNFTRAFKRWTGHSPTDYRDHSPH